LADFEVHGIALSGMKAGVTAHDHLLFIVLDERLKDRVRDVRRIALPRHDEVEFVNIDRM